MMKNWDAIQKRYLRDDLPVRLGGIAANLGRVKSFAIHDVNRDAVASSLEESKFFIEWTAAEADVSTAAELVELQVQLSLWQRAWDEIWPDHAQRQHVANVSGQWSQRVLELSGLLD
ncbi:MAG TPA: hypothetical protein PLJ78_03305 [Anaerolineae bacterium]|nr:hypothetical protein [Anaerolineae bacterium]HQK12955.1 hypothetical protein [Anaerolineae bacterium]